MYRLLYIVVLLSVANLLTACSYDKHANEAIEKALTVLEENPDSALSLLNNIKGVEKEWPKSQRMRYELVYAQVQNKAYVPFTSDSIVLEVADYYNRHGSDNERMMAYYMVGCAYRDLGDAPTALKHFRLAAEAADTTAPDCDLSTLMRVHSQTELLFEEVEAFEKAIEEALRGEQLAWQIGDTLSAIQLKWARACTLSDTRHFEKSLAIIDTLENFRLAHHFDISPGYIYPIRINCCMSVGDTIGTGELLQQFEQEFFKPSNREKVPDVVFYRLKGHYFNMIEQPDSAIRIFRLLINSPVFTQGPVSDILENHEDFYRGLQNAYTLKHEADSAVKYARLYCEYNDSVTHIHSSKNLLRMQSLYNYSKAQKEALESEQKALRLLIILIITVFGAILVAFGIWKINKKRLEEERQKQVQKNSEYLKLLQGFEKSSKELQLFRSNTEQFKKEKEEEIHKLRKALSLYQADTLDLDDWDKERNILNCEVAEHLHSISSRGQKATTSELDRLILVAQSGFSAFYEKITDESIGLTEKEIAICTLIRFRFISSEIAVLTGLSPQRITNLKSTINKKLFHTQGAKTLESRLISLK